MLATTKLDNCPLNRAAQRWFQRLLSKVRRQLFLAGACSVCETKLSAAVLVIGEGDLQNVTLCPACKTEVVRMLISIRAKHRMA
jgi:hypothetical protein